MQQHEQRVIDQLDVFPQYKETVFNYGFILKKGNVALSDQYPFYGNWQVQPIGHYQLYYHNKLGGFTFKMYRRRKGVRSRYRERVAYNPSFSILLHGVMPRDWIPYLRASFGLRYQM